MQPTPIQSSDLLAGTGLVLGMSPEQIGVLASLGTEEVYQDSETLVDRGDSDFDLMLILSGKCEIRTAMNDVLDKQGPDSLIGELSFLDRKPRSAKVVAVGECRAVRFPATLIQDLETSRPDIVAKLMKNIGLVLCKRLRSTTRFAEAGFV